MWTRIQRFLKNEDGPTAVEYAVMLALIVMVCFASIFSIGESADSIFGDIAVDAFGDINNP